jgi:hypothetical protein
VTADAVREKLKGEAEGLTEKAAAMAALNDASREHEEFRLRLEAEKDIRLAGIDVQRQVAEAQANVVSAGLAKANIDIVGGDSVFFDRLMSSITMGKSVDGFVEHSEVAQGLARPYLSGESNFTDDLTRVLGSVGAAGIRDLTISALLLGLIRDGGPESEKLREFCPPHSASASPTSRWRPSTVPSSDSRCRYV